MRFGSVQVVFGRLRRSNDAALSIAHRGRAYCFPTLFRVQLYADRRKKHIRIYPDNINHFSERGQHVISTAKKGSAGSYGFEPRKPKRERLCESSYYCSMYTKPSFREAVDKIVYHCLAHSHSFLLYTSCILRSRRQRSWGFHKKIS